MPRLAAEMGKLLGDMRTHYDELSKLQCDAMVGTCFGHLCVFSKLWLRCNVGQVKEKTAEITKKDVGLNNLLMRSKPSLRD